MKKNQLRTMFSVLFLVCTLGMSACGGKSEIKIEGSLEATVTIVEDSKEVEESIEESVEETEEESVEATEEEESKEEKPSDSKEEEKPSKEEKPSESKEQEKPSKEDTKPSETPKEDKPSTQKPSENKPADKPTESKPEEQKPSTEQTPTPTPTPETPVVETPAQNTTPQKGTECSSSSDGYHLAVHKTEKQNCEHGDLSWDICAYCGVEYNKVESGSGTGHVYEWRFSDFDTIKNLRCDQDSLMTYSCVKCYKQIKQERRRLDHDSVVEYIDATCTCGAYILTTCKNCNYRNKEYTSEPLGHNFITITDDYGETDTLCERCRHGKEALGL